MNTRAVGQMTEMYENDVKRLNQRVAQLEAELAAAKGDAERYRLVVKNKQEVRRLIDTFWRGYDSFDAAIDKLIDAFMRSPQ